MDKKATVSAITMIVLIALGISNQAVQPQPNALGIKGLTTSEIAEQKDQLDAPIAIVGDNVYIV